MIDRVRFCFYEVSVYRVGEWVIFREFINQFIAHFSVFNLYGNLMSHIEIIKLHKLILNSFKTFL